jgi:hypothetical protein
MFLANIAVSSAYRRLLIGMPFPFIPVVAFKYQLEYFLSVDVK